MIINYKKMHTAPPAPQLHSSTLPVVMNEVRGAPGPGGCSVPARRDTLLSVLTAQLAAELHRDQTSHNDRQLNTIDNHELLNISDNNSNADHDGWRVLLLPYGVAGLLCSPVHGG